MQCVSIFGCLEAWDVEDILILWGDTSLSDGLQPVVLSVIAPLEQTLLCRLFPLVTSKKAGL